MVQLVTYSVCLSVGRSQVIVPDRERCKETQVVVVVNVGGTIPYAGSPGLCKISR